MSTTARVQCPACHAALAEREGRFGRYLTCAPCDVRVGLYRDGRPKGTPADTATRAARIEAHRAFDRLWLHADERTGVWTQPEPERTRAIRRVRKAARTRAYAWLAGQLGLPVERCHIASFDLETCARVVALVEARLGAEALP